MIDYTASSQLRRAATLLDGAYRYGLEQDQLPDKTLFALHEAAEIQVEIMRFAGFYGLPATSAADPGPALAGAADHVHDAVAHLQPCHQPIITGYERRLRRLVEQVGP